MSPFSQFTRELSWQLKSTLRYSFAVQHKRGITPRAALLCTQTPEQIQRLAVLQQQYPLSDWPRLCSTSEYSENLYVLDVLTQHLSNSASKGQGLDIGCRNFSHLPALSAYTQGPWTGVELDAHARYWNGFTRRAYGEWMARQRAGSQYVAGSILDIQGHFQTIVWILPFILLEPLMHWGLPSRFFQPRDLLQKAWELLSEDGELLIINQGEAEAAVQQELFVTLNIKAQALGEIHSVFSPFKRKRFGWLVRKSTA